MKIEEYRLNEYRHQFLTIEADDLTETLKERIEIHEDDCFALCSCYCSDDGEVMFNVLSVGPDWENCTRGLDDPEMLGFWSMQDVFGRTARLVESDEDLLKKNASFLAGVEKNVDEDLLFLRNDARLDDLRNAAYADIVLTGFLSDDEIHEYEACLSGTDGPFITGYTAEDVPGLPDHTPFKAMPYAVDDQVRLLALFIGDKLSVSDEEAMQKIRQLSEQLGIAYEGRVYRS